VPAYVSKEGKQHVGPPELVAAAAAAAFSAAAWRQQNVGGKGRQRAQPCPQLAASCCHRILGQEIQGVLPFLEGGVGQPTCKMGKDSGQSCSRAEAAGVAVSLLCAPTAGGDRSPVKSRALQLLIGRRDSVHASPGRRGHVPVDYKGAELRPSGELENLCGDQSRVQRCSGACRSLLRSCFAPKPICAHLSIDPCNKLLRI
jgi:hypothetical protein